MSEHYFSPSEEEATHPKTHRVHFRARGRDLELLSAQRVFSGAALDLGTAQLLDRAPALPPTGTFLDLGCGWGPVAVTMALDSPDATVWAVDVNRVALALTEKNAKLAGADNVIAQEAGQALERAEAEGTKFDVIWSNPPIRVGKDRLHGMLNEWLPRLSLEGAAYLVVSRNLGADTLADWLRQQGYTVTRLASKKGYRILEVRRSH